MANMMATPGAAGPGAADAQDFHSAVDQGADAFAKQLEESGIPPGDFLKQLLADVMAEENGSAGAAGSTKPSPAPAAGAAETEQPENFNDAIQRTIERMKQSGDRATEAVTTGDGLEDDLIAQLLKAVEAGASGAGDDGDLTKMFMGMMEQLSNKEMLYEPMKELDGKFGPWIEKSKAEGTVPVEDMERYETQEVSIEMGSGFFRCKMLTILAADASCRQSARGADFQSVDGRPRWCSWWCTRRNARLPAAIRF